MTKYCYGCDLEVQDDIKTCPSCGGRFFRGTKKPTSSVNADPEISEQSYRKHMMTSTNEVTKLIKDVRLYFTLMFVFAIIAFLVNALVSCGSFR